MFKKKETDRNYQRTKRKKVRTFKVGTHKKSVIAVVGGAYRKRELWGV